MKITHTRRLAWFLAILAISLTAGGTTLLIITVNTPVHQSWGFRGFSGIFGVSLALVGLMIASRRPENMIGWIFLAGGVLAGIQVFVENYAVNAVLAHAGAWHGGIVAAWLANWIWVPGVGLLVTLLLLLFPDGRLPSSRWRWAVTAAVVGIAAGAVGIAFAPGVLPDFPAVQNPYSISSASAAQALANFGFLAMLAAVIASVTAQSLQLRRAQGLKRQQMKWFAAAASFAAAALVVNAVLSVLFGGSLTTNPDNTFAYKASAVVVIVAIALIPVATGIAILRYRLYDVDIVIRRTLVYGPLTAALAGVFAATISVTQKLFVAATGERSDAAVVITTLVIVSLATPARTFIQAVVDRRFKNVHDPRKEMRCSQAMWHLWLTCWTASNCCGSSWSGAWTRSRPKVEPSRY